MCSAVPRSDSYERNMFDLRLRLIRSKGEGRFSPVASAHRIAQKVLQSDYLGKFERRKKTEATDAPVTAYSPTARRYSFTTLSELWRRRSESVVSGIEITAKAPDFSGCSSLLCHRSNALFHCTSADVLTDSDCCEDSITMGRQLYLPDDRIAALW